MNQSQHSLQDLEIDYEHPPPVSHVTMPNKAVEKKSSISSCTESGKRLPQSGGDLESKPESMARVSAGMIMRQTSRTRGSYSVKSCASLSDDEESLSKTRKHFRHKYSSFRSDRNAFLEQTKSRSWSNLSGYDSAGPNSSISIQKNSKANAEWNGSLSRSVQLSSHASVKDHNPRNGHFHYIHRNNDGKPPSAGRKINPYEQYAQYARRTRRISGNAAELEVMARTLQISGNEVEVTEPNFLPADIQAAPPVNSNKSMLVKPRSHKTKVSFSNVEVRQYERILGDNPAVSCGPPISIGWNYLEERTVRVPIDDYEYYHCGYHDDCEMILSREERAEMLLDLGFDQKEIARSVRINYKLKRNRRQTVNNLSVMPIEEAVESAKKSVSRLFQGKKRREHRKYKEWRENVYDGFDNVSLSTKCTSQSGKKGILKIGTSVSDLCNRTAVTKTTQQTIANTTSPTNGDREFIKTTT